MILVIGLSSFLRALLWGSAAIALENLALRHQLLVLQRSVGRPRLSRWDRIFWVWLSRLWASWRSSLVIVQPATVLAWHRQGFQLWVIGSIRRECLDHFIILSEAHLRRLLRAYLAYYNTVRPHQALENNSPRPRDAQPPALGGVIAIPQVGGLHHHYQRAA